MCATTTRKLDAFRNMINSISLLQYAIFLLIILGLEIAAGIYAAVFRSTASDYLVRNAAIRHVSQEASNRHMVTGHNYGHYLAKAVSKQRIDHVQ